MFLTHRIIRIYPIYLIVVLIYYITSRFLRIDFLFDPQAILLIPGSGHFYVLGVEWTLPFELTFYIIIFLIILLRVQRALAAISIVWAAGILTLAHFRPEFGQDRFPQILDVPLSQWTLPFVFGLLIPFMLRQGLQARFGLLLGLVFLALINLFPAQGQLMLAGACFFFVAWAATPRNRNSDRDRLKLLTKFGDWSYALYLCHVPIIQFIVLRYPKSISPSVVFVFSVLTTLVIASLIGRLDMFLYGRLKGVIDRSGPTVNNGVASAFLAMMVLFGIYAEAVAAADRASLAADDALGARLAASPLEIDRSAQSFGLRNDKSIVGSVDAIALDPSDQIQISGWALDPADPSRKVSLLFFHGGAYLGAVLTHVARPDVDEALHIRSIFSRRGFSATLRAPPSCKPGEALVILIATEDGRFASTAPPSQFEVCRPANSN